MKAGKLSRERPEMSVIGLSSKILVGSTTGSSASIEACELKNDEFSCVPLNATFENYKYSHLPILDSILKGDF